MIDKAAWGPAVVAALMLCNLKAIAPLITLFFLITYAMINVVVTLEQGMKLVSFRPLFRVPRLVSALDAFGCAFAMIVVNSTFSILAIGVVLIIHTVLIRHHLEALFGDVRSGLFVAVAEWAAKKTGELSAARERTWKANLLFVTLPESTERQAELAEIIATARHNKIGVLLFADPEGRGLDPCRRINVWFSDRRPDWEVSMDQENQDLAILVGYKLMKNRETDLCFVASLENDSHVAAAEHFSVTSARWPAFRRRISPSSPALWRRHLRSTLAILTSCPWPNSQTSTTWGKSASSWERPVCSRWIPARKGL